MRSGGNNFNSFPENQLIKFSAVLQLQLAALTSRSSACAHWPHDEAHVHLCRLNADHCIMLFRGYFHLGGHMGGHEVRLGGHVPTQVPLKAATVCDSGVRVT